MAKKNRPPIRQQLERAVQAYNARDWARAERLCRELLQERPGIFDALSLLGAITAQTGRLDEAAELFSRAVGARPDSAMTLNHFGNVLRMLGRHAEAAGAYQRAVSLQPGYAHAHSNLGVALADLGRLDEALASYDRAVSLQPDLAEAWYNRGNALKELLRLEEAVASHDRAIALHPQHAEAHVSRAIALQALGQGEAALAGFEKATALRPDHAQAWNDCGDTLVALGRLAEAKASYERALSLRPDFEYLPGKLLYVRASLCDWAGLDAQVAELAHGIERGERVSPCFPVLSLIDSASVQHKAAQIWSRDRNAFDASLGPLPRRVRGGKLRVGYFSANFHDHATGHLMAGLFEQHDRKQFEWIAFSYGPDTGDAMRRRLMSAFDRFIDVRGKSDRAVALLAREMELDIAVDLMGYTRGERVGIFTLRAAPVQVNFLGYPGTLGAGHMDYLIADATVVPEGAEVHCTERIVRMPHSYFPNDSRRAIADKAYTRAELGLPEGAFVFCSFNNNYKIMPAMFDAWMRILGRVPGSVLWLLEDNAPAAVNLRREAEARSVDAGRLVFAPRIPADQHVARHRIADLFLDTLPVNAHTTCCDALWAGLPALTCAGESFVARVAASLLVAADLQELVTHTLAEYEELAVGLAQDAARLAAIRGRLQARRLTLPLFDTAGYARHLESAYLQMAERHHAGLPPADIQAG